MCAPLSAALSDDADGFVVEFDVAETRIVLMSFATLGNFRRSHAVAW